MGSETTAAAAGAVGKLRRDPFAMLPFCGYHMADYFGHWLEIGRREDAVLPKIFYVNWFRKDPRDGRWLWPGFGDNARVLEWVFRRCDEAVEAADTPIGRVPTADGLDTDGLAIGDDAVAELLKVDPGEWLGEIEPIREFYAQFGEKLPDELRAQLDGAGAAPAGGGAGLARQHVDEAGEAALEVVAAQRDDPLRPLGARARDARLAQQPQVVGARRRRQAEPLLQRRGSCTRCRPRAGGRSRAAAGRRRCA